MSATTYRHVTRHLEGAPEGPATGAFFDFDGTVIACQSAFVFLREQFKQGYIKRFHLARVAMGLANYQAGLIDFTRLMEIGAEILEGVDEGDYKAFSQTVFQQHLQQQIYPEIKALIEAHQAKGHTVAIVSSASSYQVQATAQALGIEHLCTSAYAVEDGKLTGALAAPICWQEGKVVAMESLAEHLGVSLEDSYFYGDTEDDLPALQRVGHPRPVNANEGLQTIASKQGWPLQQCARLGKPGLLDSLRSIGVYAALIGGYFGGLGVWKFNGSKDEGQKFMLSAFTDIALPLANLKVKVRNPENLCKRQPAVVIFNHQSQADGIVMMKLLKDNFAAIGKKEIGRFKLFAKAYEFAGVITIDRGDTQSAIEAMQPLVDALVVERRNVAIAPEGTRSTGKKPGPFKKGAFHVAMQAGAPIVPVVIHNAIDVQPKGQFAYRPGCIEVEVLEPIETSGWTKATLDQRVAEVRDRFLTTLGFEAEGNLQNTASENKLAESAKRK